jgi:hypothetical protein
MDGGARQGFQPRNREHEVNERLAIAAQLVDPHIGFGD